MRQKNLRNQNFLWLFCVDEVSGGGHKMGENDKRKYEGALRLRPNYWHCGFSACLPPSSAHSTFCLDGTVLKFFPRQTPPLSLPLPSFTSIFSCNFIHLQGLFDKKSPSTNTSTLFLDAPGWPNIQFISSLSLSIWNKTEHDWQPFISSPTNVSGIFGHG